MYGTKYGSNVFNKNLHSDPNTEAQNAAFCKKICEIVFNDCLVLTFKTGFLAHENKKMINNSFYGCFK